MSGEPTPEQLSQIGHCYKRRPQHLGGDDDRERSYWKLLWPMELNSWYCEQLHVNTKRTFMDSRPTDALEGSYPTIYIWLSVIEPIGWDGERIADVEYEEAKSQILHQMGICHTNDFPLRGTLARQAAAKAEEWIKLALQYEKTTEQQEANEG